MKNLWSAEVNKASTNTNVNHDNKCTPEEMPSGPLEDHLLNEQALNFPPAWTSSVSDSVFNSSFVEETRPCRVILEPMSSPSRDMDFYDDNFPAYDPENRAVTPTSNSKRRASESTGSTPPSKATAPNAKTIPQ